MKVARIRRLEELASTAQGAPGSGVVIADDPDNYVGVTLEEILAEIADALRGEAGDPIDVAIEGVATTRNDIAPEFEVVQQVAGVNVANGTQFTLPSPPTSGNTLIIWQTSRSGTSSGPGVGWTAHPSGVVSAIGFGDGAFFYRVVEPGDPSVITADLGGGSQPYPGVLLEVAGIGDLDTSNETTYAASPFAIGQTTAGAAFLIAGAVIHIGDSSDESVTPDADTTELFDEHGPAPVRSPLSWVGYRLVTAAGAYDLGGSCSSGGADIGLQALAFAMAEPPWDIPAPNTNDGDDATFEEIDGPDVLRIDLGAPYRITSTRLVIGCEFAGAKTYVIRGSVDESFDPDLSAVVATLNFTATGSFTADEVEASWSDATAYQYFELTGDDETRRVFSWELFQAPFVISVDHGDLSGLGDDDHPQYATDVDLDAHVDDTTDAHDASAISAADAGGWFTGTEVEAQLQELAAKVVGYEPHGNMGAAVTFNTATGWHSGTFDANCTFTLTAAPTSTVSSLFLELATGAGGFTLTLPSSVVNKAAIEAAQDTTAGTTAFLVLLSRDGGTTWYGGWWGGPASAPALEILDEGGSLTAAPTSMDFVGAGVTATAVGDDVTVTIPGTPTGAAGGGLGGTYPNPSVDDDGHSHTSTTLPAFVGALLIADVHSTPLVFDDLLQNEDGDDLLYADV